MFDKLIQLECDVQHYPWGARRRENGTPPLIADLTGRDPEAEQPFAELWIGAHPKLPARAVLDTGTVPLNQLIDAYPAEILGTKVLAAGFGELPFLLKILDCDQPLSIQAHPDLERAAVLHEKDPEHYPDANHKPEIAIGITGMTAFCQFRPAADIQADIGRIPALKQFFSAASSGPEAGSRAWLRQLYKRVFSASQTAINDVLQGVADWISDHGACGREDKWFMKLRSLHPGDRGLLSAFFLNIVDLGPEEGIFLAPNEPHAYLKGTIVECMASSDNVVRAGLTPKFIDRDVLVEMISCQMGRPETDMGESLQAGEKVYRVPVPEFQVETYQHDAGTVRDYVSGGAVSLLLVLEGDARMETPEGTIAASKGSVWLWPAALEACRITYLASGTKIVRARPNMQMVKREA